MRLRLWAVINVTVRFESTNVAAIPYFIFIFYSLREENKKVSSLIFWAQRLHVRNLSTSKQSLFFLLLKNNIPLANIVG